MPDPRWLKNIRESNSYEGCLRELQWLIRGLEPDAIDVLLGALCNEVKHGKPD